MNKTLKKQGDIDSIDYMKKTFKKKVDPIVEIIFNHIKSLANGESVHVKKFTEIYDTINFAFDLSDRQLDSIKDLCYMADTFKETIKKENSSLASYLQTKLTINSKEAELIESVIKTYVRNKKQR